MIKILKNIYKNYLERVLVLELERLKRRGSGAGNDGRTINQLEEHIRGIENDRDYWRNQVDLLQQIISCPGLINERHKTPVSRLKSKPPIGQSITKLSNLGSNIKQRKVN